MNKEQVKAEAWQKYRKTCAPNQWNTAAHNNYLAGFDAGYAAANQWQVIETDGLPEEDGNYLTTYLGYNPLSDDVDGPPCTCEFGWFKDEWIYDDGFPARVKVIAWRPLPEPYQPTEGEGDSE